MPINQHCDAPIRGSIDFTRADLAVTLSPRLGFDP